MQRSYPTARVRDNAREFNLGSSSLPVINPEFLSMSRKLPSHLPITTLPTFNPDTLPRLNKVPASTANVALANLAPGIRPIAGPDEDINDNDEQGSEDLLS